MQSDFDIFHSCFQNEFSELTEPCPYPERAPDYHLESLLPHTYGRKVWQFTDVEPHLLDDTVRLVKHIEESSIRKVEILAEAVDDDDYPVSVATVTFLDCWSRISRDSTLRQCYEAAYETRDGRTHYSILCLILVRPAE